MVALLKLVRTCTSSFFHRPRKGGLCCYLRHLHGLLVGFSFYYQEVIALIMCIRYRLRQNLSKQTSSTSNLGLPRRANLEGGEEGERPLMLKNWIDL